MNPENLVLGSTALVTEVIGATAAWIHDQGKHVQCQQSILREDPISLVFQRLGEREDMQKRLKEKKVIERARLQVSSGKNPAY